MLESEAKQQAIITCTQASWVPDYVLKRILRRRSQDGGGVGQGEHFLPHKFIKRAFERRVDSTRQLLNAGGGHQAPRKAIQLFGGRWEKI